MQCKRVVTQQNYRFFACELHYSWVGKSCAAVPWGSWGSRPCPEPLGQWWVSQSTLRRGCQQDRNTWRTHEIEGRWSRWLLSVTAYTIKSISLQDAWLGDEAERHLCCQFPSPSPYPSCTSCASHTLGWRCLVLNLESFRPSVGALLTELPRHCIKQTDQTSVDVTLLWDCPEVVCTWVSTWQTMS